MLAGNAHTQERQYSMDCKGEKGATMQGEQEAGADKAGLLICDPYSKP